VVTAALALERVTFAWDGGPPALRDVSLAVAPGERVALLGANGSGKSTLLRLLDGLVAPAAGTVRAFGEDLAAVLADDARARAFRRRVGLVFQSADAQLFSTTVREEIAFGPLQLGLAPGEVVGRVADLAAMMEIAHLLDRPPFRLSGGEKKKVAIASVLAVNPEVILLDEPTGGLDPRSQSWLLDVLDGLHAAGKTLIAASNELDLVPALADRVVVLDEQHGVAADGAVAAVLDDRALLRRVNLVHEHEHRHGATWHAHPHHHAGEHHHEHGDPHGDGEGHGH
jgi:cobalt/nickel transport system ATP-binding protein